MSIWSLLMNFWRTLFDRQLKPYKPAYPVTAVTQPTPTGTTVSAAPLGFQTLTLSSTSYTQGTPATGTINNALFGTVIVAVGLPAGLTINSALRTWAWDGSGSGSGSFTLYENTPGASTNPHASVISYVIASSGGGLGGAGTLSAPTLGYPSPQASNPTTVSVAIGNDWQSGDILKLAYSLFEAMSSPTTLTHTLIDADVTGGSITLGIPTLAGATYFQAYGSHSGADSANLSNKVKWGDTTAPTIATSATQSQMELFPLAVSLTANETVSWSITGGADQSQFTLSGSTLEWFGNGTQNYDVPADSDTNNTYAVQVSATDLGGNVSNQTITVTVTAADKTPDAFTFTDVPSATVGTAYTSNAVTISGLTTGISVPATVAGAQYSKNGGSFQAAGTFTVQNGDTVALKVTAAAGTVSGTLTISGVSDSYDVSDGSVTQWKIVVTNAIASSDRTRIAELQMRATVGGTNLCTGGTPFGDSPEFGNSSYVPASAFDGNASTLFSAAPCPVTLGYTFAANTPTVLQIAITASNVSGDNSWAPQAFSLQKLSGGSWTTVQSWTTGSWTLGETRTFNV